MKTRKECSETNPRHKMMESDDTLIDIENTYGKEVKDALVEYCKLKKLTPDAVIDDMSEDGNGMTEWDKFDNWAEKKLGLDIMGKFKTDDYDWTGADTARKEQDDWEAEHGEEERFMEGSRSNPIDEGYIVNWIGEELMACEWVDPDEIKFYPDEAVEITTSDDDVYRVQVTKVYSAKLGEWL